MPAGRIPGLGATTHSHPGLLATHTPGRPELVRYATGVGAALVLIPASAWWGGRGAWLALVGLATIGLAGLSALVLANVGLGILWLRSRLWRAA